MLQEILDPSIYCFYHGYMGGQDLLTYSNICLPEMEPEPEFEPEPNLPFTFYILLHVEDSWAGSLSNSNINGKIMEMKQFELVDSSGNLLPILEVGYWGPWSTIPQENFDENNYLTDGGVHCGALLGNTVNNYTITEINDNSSTHYVSSFYWRDIRIGYESSSENLDGNEYGRIYFKFMSDVPLSNLFKYRFKSESIHSPSSWKLYLCQDINQLHNTYLNSFTIWNNIQFHLIMRMCRLIIVMKFQKCQLMFY